MQILDTSAIPWGVAKKTKPLRAKPMVTLLVDKSVMAKFLVDTLEAREAVGPNAMFCIGESNDAWQQTPKKLLDKYNVTNIDDEGWMVCVPKPENSVEFVEVTRELLERNGVWEAYLEAGCGYLQGEWGQTYEGHENLQQFSLGDFIARNREDIADQWVVRRKIWVNSYTALNG